MYDKTISFLSAYGLVPKSWSEQAAKSTIQAVQTSTFFPFGEKISAWIDNVYIMQPHIAFLGLYSAAVMTWFVLTGISGEETDGKEVHEQMKTPAEKKSAIRTVVSKKKDVTEQRKHISSVTIEVLHDRGDAIMERLGDVFKESSTHHPDTVNLVQVKYEKQNQKADPVEREPSKALNLKSLRPRINKEGKNLVKDVKELDSKEPKEVFNERTKSTLRSGRSILNLQTLHKALQLKKDTDEQFLCLLDEIQSDELLSDTSKDFENEHIQRRVDLTKPVLKINLEETKMDVKRKNKTKRQLSGFGLYNKFLSDPGVRPGVFGSKVARIRDIKGKMPIATRKQNPKPAVSTHSPFRLTSTGSQATDEKIAQKKKLNRKSLEDKLSSSKFKGNFERI